MKRWAIMRQAPTILIGLWLGLFAAAASAQFPAVAPEDFSHVVGDWFRIEVSATPTHLAVEDPLILSVRISAKTSLGHIALPGAPDYGIGDGRATAQVGDGSGSLEVSSEMGSVVVSVAE